MLIEYLYRKSIGARGGGGGGQWRRKWGGWGVSSPPKNGIGGAEPLL